MGFYEIVTILNFLLERSIWGWRKKALVVQKVSRYESW